MTEYENLAAQHKLLKNENKRKEHRLLMEAIDNLTAERDALRAEVERLRDLLSEVSGCFTRNDDLPDNLLQRIEEAMKGTPE